MLVYQRYTVYGYEELSTDSSRTTRGIGFTEQVVCFSLKIVTFRRLFKELLNQY